MTDPLSKSPAISNAELLTIEEATKQLGKGFSRRSILRRIDRGEWVEGVHWIDDRRKGGINRIIKINITAIQQWRTTPAAFR